MLEIKLAVAQWDVRFNDPAYNRQQSLYLIEQAAAAGARLILLPELCISGYSFHDAQEAHALAEPCEGTTEAIWREAAATHQIAIAGGVAIRDGDALYNSLVCISPEGEIVRYHKVHLFDRELLFFTPGAALQLWQWEGITFGLMICYDGWFPEHPRCLALAGADILLAPGCWHQRPPLAGDIGPGQLLHLAAAYSNSVFVACASRSGRERENHFAGDSCIIGPHGRLVGPAGDADNTILVADIDLRQARFKHRTRRVHPLKNRRPELYGALASTPPKAKS